jgi:putative NADPH-quinone reductase
LILVKACDAGSADGQRSKTPSNEDRPAMPRLTMIQGHPDPSGNRLCHALADAYAEGAAAGGHEVIRIEVARLDFPILRTREEFETGQLPESLTDAQRAIVSAEHLLMIFPLWHGTMPALLKAFIEQVMRPGVTLEYRKHGFPKGLLAGRSARLVVTMGMPALIYRWYFRAHGVHGLERSVLRFAGMKPVRETLLGMVDTASAAKRGKWLDRMRDYGRRLI